MKHMYALLAVLGMLTSIQLVHAQAMTTMQGINNATSIQPAAWPDPTIAVGTLEFCENVNSAYQCWYKSTHKPVSFFGTTTPKSDKSIWTQNSNNSGNTPELLQSQPECADSS